MKSYAIQTLIFTLFLLVFAGCDSNDPDEIESITGTFEMEVSGDINQTITGIQAAFGVGNNAQTGVTGFGLNMGATNGSTAQSISLVRQNGRPGTGNHAIANFSAGSNPEDIDNDLFIGTFSTGSDVFYSTGGTLNITSSAENRLEGSINMTMQSILGSMAQVTIQGTFTAVGAEITVQ